MGNPFVTVTLDVEVEDRLALWTAARDYLVGTGNLEPDSLGDDVIGTAEHPKVGACLIMLLDRSENIPGAEIQNSSHDYDDGED